MYRFVNALRKEEPWAVFVGLREFLIATHRYVDDHLDIMS